MQNLVKGCYQEYHSVGLLELPSTLSCESGAKAIIVSGAYSFHMPLYIAQKVFKLSNNITGYNVGKDGVTTKDGFGDLMNYVMIRETTPQQLCAFIQGLPKSRFENLLQAVKKIYPRSLASRAFAVMQYHTGSIFDYTKKEFASFWRALTHRNMGRVGEILYSNGKVLCCATMAIALLLYTKILSEN